MRSPIALCSREYRRTPCSLCAAVLFFVVCSPAVGQLQAPDPEVPPPVRSIEMPNQLTVREQTIATVKGITLTEFAEGQAKLRVYPNGGAVQVTDSISVLRKVPQLIVFPRQEGSYTLVLALVDKEGRHVFLEVPFTVTKLEPPQ